MLKSKNKILSITLLVALLFVSISFLPGGIQAADKLDVTGSNVFADIAEQADQGVVKVTSKFEVQGYNNNNNMSPFYNDPFFQYFFGDQMPSPDMQKPRTEEAFGSGFVVSNDGYIVTNGHVIQDADKVEVTIKGNEDPVPAEVVWSDFSLDLAVLKVNTDQELKPLTMGDSSVIRPGDWAIAIGNPFGFEHTVTVGVISALGRPIQIPTGQGQVRSYRNLIQLDAAINPGNSGGPLLNINGEVIGINTAVSTQGQGIGFAIPINEIKDIVAQLKSSGQVIQPWLGIYYRQINDEIKDYFNLENTNGVLIVDVVKDSPAAKAGLQPYDVIKEIEKQPIENIDQVQEIVKSKEVGEKILLKVVRNGNTQLIFAEIGNKSNKPVQ